MCGIAGLIGQWGGDRSLIEAMTRTMTHRGPDDEGYWMCDKASIGMRRLSIIDVQHGQQPYSNESGSIVAVFNGEIYNHEALRAKLLAAGHQLTSHADGEVIAHLYEDDPDGFMAALDGMFAIAIVDRDRNRLVLVRDRWGKKPLLYSDAGGTLAFASEMRSMLVSPSVTAVPDEMAIDAYLTLGYVPSPQTAVHDVRQLPPGHLLVADLDGSILRLQSWWEPMAKPDERIKLADAVEHTGELLTNAVRKRLASERPVGIFLSGGVDSSLIAAAAVRVATGPVHTFSIGFADPDYDETAHAEHVARTLGTQHTTFKVDDLVSAMVEELPEILDQPFADSSIIPTLLLARLARGTAVVALGGDGGDELFGGYVRYRAAPMLQRMQHLPGLFSLGRRAPRTLARVLGSRRAARLIENMTSFSALPDRYLATIAVDRQHRSRLASTAFISAWDAQQDLPARMRPRATDLRTYLPSDILFKADIATMANGLELRSPLLDQQLSAYALTLPERLLFTQGGKPVLKALARAWIDGFDASRPKMGFGIPASTLLETTGQIAMSATSSQSWSRWQLERWRERWLEDSHVDSAYPEPGSNDASR